MKQILPSIHSDASRSVIVGSVLPFLFLLAAGVQGAVPDATPTPTPQVTLAVPALHLAADPIRPRVYATVPSTNSVVVIDTNTLSVIKTIPIGSSPRGLTISADRSTLWVANSGSTNFAIGAIDLESLTTLPALAAPTQPSDLEEGLGHRLYVTPASSSGSSGIMQINAETGTFEGYISGFTVYSGGFVEISPDRRRLFFGTAGLSPSTLAKVDVSNSTGALIQQTNNVGSNGESLAIDHAGDVLVFPNGGGNGSGYSTFAIPTADIQTVNGSFNVGAYPGPSVFSNDDRLLYHGAYSSDRITIFDACLYTPVTTFPIGGGNGLSDVAVDRSGQWLFVATSLYGAGDIRIFATGRNDVRVPVPLRAVSRQAQAGAFFDLDLPLRCGAMTESRVGQPGGTHQIIVTFPFPVSIGGASLTTAQGKSAELDGPLVTSADNRSVTVNLKNVSDVQTLTLTLLSVSDGSLVGDVPVVFNVLAGDANGDGVVNSGDATLTRNRSGQAISAANFRSDVNGDGAINSGDAILIRNRSGNSLP